MGQKEVTSNSTFLMGRICGALVANKEWDETYQIKSVHKTDGNFVFKVRDSGNLYEVSVRQITND